MAVAAPKCPRGPGAAAAGACRSQDATGNTGVLEERNIQKPRVQVGSWKVSVTEAERGGFGS